MSSLGLQRADVFYCEITYPKVKQGDLEQEFVYKLADPKMMKGAEEGGLVYTNEGCGLCCKDAKLWAKTFPKMLIDLEESGYQLMNIKVDHMILIDEPIVILVLTATDHSKSVSKRKHLTSGKSTVGLEDVKIEVSNEGGKDIKKIAQKKFSHENDCLAYEIEHICLNHLEVENDFQEGFNVKVLGVDNGSKFHHYKTMAEHIKYSNMEVTNVVPPTRSKSDMKHVFTELSL